MFIRSLANRNQLGGVATEVWPMSWLMLACFDIVVIETVGVGQTEIDIAEIGDTVCYVAQPASGDTIQYLKSGIIEIPDIFAVNKSDLGAPARKTASEIRRCAPRPDRRDAWDYPVCLVSATNNSGITEFHDHFDSHRQFLVDAGLLGELRARHQTAVGGAAAERGVRDVRPGVGRRSRRDRRRLGEHRCNQFGEYARLRDSVRSRLTSVNRPTL